MFEEEKVSSNENNKFEDKETNNKGSGIDLNLENNNNEVGLKNEDSEVVITTNQFNKIIEGIFMKIAEHLLTNKSTARGHFKDIIYSHELNNEIYEAIPLQYLLDDLEKINIKIDTIGIHCLYEKLKYSDDFESIDVAKLVEELENYGIFENNNLTSNNNNSNRDNPEELYRNLSNFLREKEMQIVDLLRSHIGISKKGGKLIKIKDFEEILNENNILKKGKNSFKMIFKEIIKKKDNSYINVDKLILKLKNYMNKESEVNQNFEEDNYVKNKQEIQSNELNKNENTNRENKSNESRKSAKEKKENKEVR
jgi:hypothetical protein